MPPLSKNTYEEAVFSLDATFGYGNSYLQSATKPLSPKPTRVTVTFAPSVQVHETIHVSDFSKEEIGSAWYCNSEIKSIKSANKGIVSKMERSVDIIDESTRGLEWRTQGALQRRRRVRYEASSSVLDEQELQKEEGCFDPDFLAYIYSQYSSRCQTAAYELAVRDREAVQDLI
jgi:hypothetical protein